MKRLRPKQDKRSGRDRLRPKQDKRSGRGRLRPKQDKRSGRDSEICGSLSRSFVSRILVLVVLFLQVVLFLRLRVVLFLRPFQNFIAIPDGEREHAVRMGELSGLPPQKEESFIPQPPPYCSDAQLEAIFSRFKTPLNQTNRNKRFHTPLMRETRCPDESSVQAYFQDKKRIGKDADSFLGVNVGCNKGLDAIEMARLLSRNPRISVKDWSKAVSAKSRPICGVPKDVPLSNNNIQDQTFGKVHCIEPMSSTVRNLKKALHELKYEDSVVITQAAVSNYTGTARFPNSDVSGEEAKSLKDCEDGGSATADCVEIPVYSLDDYLREQGVLQLASNNNYNGSASMIDMLLIDAEGFDHEVLQGAFETLKRVRYLMFEVHINGNWMSHSLVKTIKTILSDFNCYWAGRNNRLWRITNCLNESIENLYEYKSWSNVACVHRRETELAAIMEEIFQKTVGVK